MSNEKMPPPKYVPHGTDASSMSEMTLGIIIGIALGSVAMFVLQLHL